MILRFILLFLLITLSLDALSDKDILKRAQGFMNSSNKSNYFRAYNDYKNLYLRSIMLENEKLQVNALKGIVSSGTKLHIDISQYSNELNALKPKSVYKKKAQVKKVPVSKKNTSNKVKIKSSHKLEYIKFINDELILKFDKVLTTRQINYFTLYDPKNKQYRYVFDIHASMLKSSHTIRKKGIKRIKLAQYKPTTLRLVIEDTKKIKVKFSKRGDKLAIRINDSQASKKAIKVFKSTSPARLDRKRVIMIDAGHGGKDPGAVGYRKYREKVVVLSVAKELKKLLSSRGYTVYMTRDKDKFIKLSKRTQYANKKNADIFVSIHANSVAKQNAHKAQGVECYFLSKSKSSRAKKVAAKENSADLSDMNYYGKESFLNTLNSHNIVASNKLAIDLQRGMLGSLKKKYKDVKDGGVREGPFWVLVGAQMPSVLVEIGFISHPTEAKRLVKTAYQKTLAYGLANGIERYFSNNK